MLNYVSYSYNCRGIPGIVVSVATGKGVALKQGGRVEIAKRSDRRVSPQTEPALVPRLWVDCSAIAYYTNPSW